MEPAAGPSSSSQPADSADPAPAKPIPFLSGQPEMIFQDLYAWVVLLASLDVILTWTILFLGGSEVNALANAVLRAHDVPGLILFKFCTVVLVVVLCEVIARKKPATGRRLAEWAVALSSIPVVIALLQLLVWALR